MSGVKLFGDWSKFDKAMHRLVRFNFLALHKNIGEQLVSSTKNRFRQQIGPDKKPWAKSFRAAVEKGKTLMDSRDLFNSLTYKAAPDRVDVGTNKIYAATHQEGAIIKARRTKFLKFKIGNSFVLKRKVKIPARPFLGINDDDYEDIKEIIQDQIEETLR
ncbi:MAG: phage virion morphogenesis protein [Peptococcaceae bacterium]|jgi:phage virion morphogenesis protein|nr:phage virion morphogenesis protein [Peptococcaceae bacterium]MDH7526039.1 phage virion morphogenesis protein [Peptococcaceae bacterium]